jgi:hypothetical protein
VAFTHDVWFREQPSTQDFWDDRLVRHELDHVRISTNPRIEKIFTELVRGDGRLLETIDEETKVTQSMVRSIVEKHVQSVFDDTIDLVQIRYQDLDAVTNHGLKPLPRDSEPMKWMNWDGFSSTD